MESVILELQSLASNPHVVLLTTVCVAVVLFVLGGGGLLAADNTVRRRLKTRVGTGRAATAGKAGNSVRSAVANSKLLRKLENHAARNNEERVPIIRRRLIQAGYMGRNAVGAYFFSRIVLGFAAPVAVLALTPIFAGSLPPARLMILGIASSMVGFYIPALWVTFRVKDRQQSAREGFPDALDLLLVCVEAGLSLAASLNRVGQEIGTARPLLAQQLKLVALEMQAGKSREQALRNLSERVGIEEVRSLVTLLLQSDALGTSISQSLRVHADEMRKRRLLKAEEQANKLPVKMAFPLVVFILPCLLTVIMTPVIIRIFRAFTAAGG